MKYSYTLLQKFIKNLPPPSKLADLLSLHSVKVENLSRGEFELASPEILIGKILKIVPHPNADRLCLAFVNIGGNKTKQIVCGASNIKEGNLVPVALPGAKLASGVRIQEREFRGLKSFGMLCSAMELGIGEGSQSILILPEKEASKIGQPLSALFEDDYILDLEITPQRGDLCSHFGLAREIAALLKMRISLPPLDSFGERKEIEHLNIEKKLEVEIVSKKDCSRYSALYITDYQSKESPFWLVKALYLLGGRAIELSVDLANYVMFLFGQPLHTFDAQKIHGQKIIVRKAKEKEELLLLSGEKILLSSEDLVIADIEKPVALAGIMGGSHSGINSSTREIVIESAHFDPITIRKTSKRHSLLTEASYRFERYVDPAQTLFSAEVLARFITCYSSAKLLKGSIDKKARESESLLTKKFFITAKEGKDFLGTKIPFSFYRRTLDNLGFKVRAEGKTLEVIPPTFRSDIDTKEAIYEEIARIQGLNNLSKNPFQIKDYLLSNKAFLLKEKIRDFSSALGFSEVVNTSFVPKKHKKTFQFAGEPIQILHPVSQENAYFRNSLLYGLLEVVYRNQFESDQKMLFFEIGRVAYYRKGAICEEEELAFIISPSEEREIKSLISALPFLPHPFSFEEIESENLRDEEGEAQKALFKNLVFLKSNLFPKDNYIGYAGSLSSEGERAFKIRRGTAFLTLRFDLLQKYFSPPNLNLRLLKKKVIFKPFSRFPRTIRDVNFIGDRIPDLKILPKVKHLEELKVLSQYKNVITIRMVIRGSDHTLTDKEIVEVEERVIRLIEEKTGLKREKRV